jgi:PIN domain nuclease of toxin-antitoxin system
MLICQAIAHDLVLLTTDQQIAKYQVRLFPNA